jgi:hypothetical protein
MVGLMTLWFGPFIELEPAHGYFYLCPECYRECVEPNMEEVQGKLAQLHPTVAAYLERQRDEEGSVESAEPEDADADGAPDVDRGVR